MNRLVFTLSLSILAQTAFAGTKFEMDTPQLSCAGGTQVSRSITVCAPPSGSGLPAGFSLQWMTCEAYAQNGNQWLSSEDPLLGKASFSGNANSSRYALAPGACVTVNVGDFLFDEGASTNSPANLTCGTCYVFRAFGHATSTLNRSAFTEDLSCSTLDCGGAAGCTATFSQWSALALPCDPGLDSRRRTIASGLWPVDSMTLGTTAYTEGQLACILGTPADSNGLIALAHQLIAAKLNEAMNGSVPSSTAVCMSDADALIGSLRVPPVGTDVLDPTATAALTSCLASYNEGAVGPGACHGLDSHALPPR